MQINKTYTIDCFAGFERIRENQVDHVLTSPPYNRKRNDKYTHYDDRLNDYHLFLKKAINESMRVAKQFVFLNIQKNYYQKQEVFRIIGEYSDKISEIIIWNKTNPMPAAGNAITNAYEFILVFSKDKSPLKANGTYTKNHFTTSAFTNNKYNKIHKAVMHPDACEYILSNFTKPGEIILDPFMGIGTTGVTAKKLNRNFIGFELHEEYSKIANDRTEHQKPEGERE